MDGWGDPGSHRAWWRNPGALAWALWALAVLGLAPIARFDQLVRQAGRPDLVQLNPGGAPFVVAVLSAATVGALLAGRRPRHPVGWLLLALGLSVILDGVADGYAGYGAVARPGALPAARYVAVYASSSLLVARVCLGFVLLLTPTGSLPSPRWRWWAWLTAATALPYLVARALLPLPLNPPYEQVPNPLAVPTLAGPLQVVRAVTGILTTLGVVVGAASLLVRYRRARGTERLQLRWVALAAALSAVMAVVVLVASVLRVEVVVFWGVGILLATLPMAVGAAVARYRLYDVDRLLNRTLVYGLVTALLGGVYAGLVLAGGQLSGGLGEATPSWVVAAATLTAAALFQPARRRIQQVVDVRFNRARYDAGRTIEAFGARLHRRVDLDGLTAELLAVVDQTVQPTRASLWLRPAGPRPPEPLARRP